MLDNTSLRYISPSGSEGNLDLDLSDLPYHQNQLGNYNDWRFESPVWGSQPVVASEEGFTEMDGEVDWQEWIQDGDYVHKSVQATVESLRYQEKGVQATPSTNTDLAGPRGTDHSRSKAFVATPAGNLKDDAVKLNEVKRKRISLHEVEAEKENWSHGAEGGLLKRQRKLD